MISLSLKLAGVVRTCHLILVYIVSLDCHVTQAC